MKHHLRSLLILATLASGCSGGDDDDDGASGTHHHYVASAVNVPTDSTESSELASDLDGDAIGDNQLGSILASLGAATTIDFQSDVDDGVVRGVSLLLIDILADDLVNDGSVEFTTFLGGNPSPAPCVDASDLVCARQLDGAGTFTAIAGSGGTPSEGALSGGTFAGAGGSHHVAFAFAGTVLNLPVDDAQVSIDAVTVTGLGALVIAGSVLATEFESQFLPAYQASVMDAATTDCTLVGPPGCGCAASSTGETVINLFDTTADCNITLAELQADVSLDTLLAPDLDADDDGTNESISLGVGMTAVGATYSQPD